MATGALPHDALLPRPPGGTAMGALLALSTHAVLIAALAWATQWRTTTPQVVTAELWASVPGLAAPASAAEAAAVAPPVQPPAPAPAQEPAAEPPAEPRAPEPEIATAKAAAERAAARREQADRARAAREQAVRERRERRERQREAEAAAAREQARQQQLRRILAQAGAGAGAPQAAASAAGSASDVRPSAAYEARLADLIRSQTVFSGDVPGNPAAEVEVRAAASGTIIARRLLRSSGHPPWDEAVLRAIDRVGTLPRDTDGRVPSTLIVAFRPKE